LQDGIVDALALSQYYADEDYSVEVAIGDAREILKQKEASFDIVYQDAFSPKKNPELWTIEYFSDIKRLLAKEAVITTYSKATPVRLALYELGFNLYEHPRGSVRGGTIASNFDTKGLQKVDMLTKIKNAPNSRALRDQDKG
jgi:tRNA U34 5-methylaminomethyl-2-thiouridine-forming methyltransferase MnmC